MLHVRSTLIKLIPLLVLGLAAAFAGCTDDNSDNNPIGDNNNNNPANSNVADLDVAVEKTEVDNYFGVTDTVNFDITCTDAFGEPVEEATPSVNISGPGHVVWIGDQETNENGLARARYVIIHNDTSRIGVGNEAFSNVEISIGGANQTYNITIRTRQVRVQLDANPDQSQVAAGADGQSSLSARVLTDQGQTLATVPLRFQIIDNPAGVQPERGSGTISSVDYDPQSDLYMTTLTVEDVVDTTMTVSVRAYVDVVPTVWDLGEDTTTTVQDPAPGNDRRLGGSRSVASLSLADTAVVRVSPLSIDVDSIYVRVVPNRIIAAPDSSKQATVHITAFDENNNGISGLQVFTRLRNMDGGSVGTVTNPDTTDANGNTTASIATNGQYGNWMVEVRTHQDQEVPYAAPIEVVAGELEEIEIRADTTRLAYWGTNGIESTQVHAILTDQNGQPVQDGRTVYFLLESFPLDQTSANPVRMRINDDDGYGSPWPNPEDPNPEYGLPHDTATTSGGVASVTVTSGTKTGSVRMRVWAYLDSTMNDSVLATYSAMQVIAGPPSSIDIDYDPDGEDGGGSVWHIEVAARVQDSRNNNVADGYSVEFTTNSDIAHFENDGVTGNPGPLGSEPQPGVAYSRLLYHSANTNQWITVTASTRRADGSMVESESTFRLPLQEAMGLLYAEPTNWNYTQMTSSPYAVFALEMVVKDGHDHLINDQLVLFNTTHGRFYPTQAIAPNTAPYAITGPADTIAGQTDDDPEGVARRYLLVLEDEAFLDPMSPLTLATVDCIIWGASDATVEPVNLQLMRNIGGQEPGGEATQAQE